MENILNYTVSNSENYKLAQLVSPQVARWLSENGNVVDGVNTDIEDMANFYYLGGKEALEEHPEDITLQALKKKIMDRVEETAKPLVAPPAPARSYSLTEAPLHK